MKNFFYLFLLLTVSSTSLAETRFNDIFDTGLSQFVDTADRVASYHAENMSLPPEQQINELAALAGTINAIIKTSETNPVYWFMSGLNESNLASVYNQLNNTTKTNEHIRNKDSAYARAIELDKINTPHLSAAMYATMKHGLPQNLKIQAIQQELALGGNGDNESYYWHLHWSNINALEEAGRLDEAQQALNNMQAELKQNNIINTDYNKIVERAQNQINQSRHNRQTKKAEAPPREPTPIKDNTKDESTMIIWSISIVALLAILTVTIYELIFRRRK